MFFSGNRSNNTAVSAIFTNENCRLFLIKNGKIHLIIYKKALKSAAYYKKKTTCK